MLQPHTDQQYIDALLNNEVHLLNELYVKYSGKIKSMILKNNGTEDDAADIFQESLIDIYNKAKNSSFILTCPLDAFLYMVCKNKWLNELRKRKNSRVTFTDTEQYNISDDSFKEASLLFNQTERGNLLLSKLSEMGDACKNLLELSWSGKPMEEVAALLNNSYGYVRKKKSECMAKLISMIKQSPQFSALQW